MTESRAAGRVGLEKQLGTVEQFVLRLLTACGASWTEREGIWTVRIPDEEAAELGLAETSYLTFDSALVGADTPFVGLGSPTFDAMIRLARKRGSAAQLLLCGFRVVKEIQRLRSAWTETGWVRQQISSALDFGTHVQVRIEGHRLIYQELFLFWFKVTYLVEEPLEELHLVAIDGVTERPVELPDDWVAAACTASVDRLHGRPTPSLDAEKYTVERGYRAACVFIEKMIAPRCERLAREAEERLRLEAERINQFYRRSAEELLGPLRYRLRELSWKAARLHGYKDPEQIGRVMELAEKLRGAEHTYQHELELLEQERMRRISELRDRFRVRVGIELVSAAKLFVPRVEWQLRLSAERMTRHITLVRDLLTGRICNLECDRCDAPPQRLKLNADGELLCPACHVGGN